ncbi:MAG: mandelate racemase/muconate lactonizing enzyme family protein [Thiolinea sp.]
MSSIKQIAVKYHCNDLGGKVWNPALRWTQKYAVFIELTDEVGRVGLGECWCFDAKPDALLAFIRTEVAPHFLGQALENAEAVMAERLQFATLSARHGMLSAALSGFDIATWDLRAQQQGMPLWQLLNPQGSGQARLYASGGLYGANKSTDDLAAEMAGLAQQGFQCSKMKVGALSLAEDMARIQAVLHALPVDSRLIIDCVYHYDYATVMQLWAQLPHQRIEALQSPLTAHDYVGMSRLVANGVPVMANEAEYRMELHRELVERQAVRYLQLAPVACGGVSRVLALAEQVADTPVQLSLEVSSTAVALMASAQLAAADHRIAPIEYHTVHQVFFEHLPLIQVQECPDVYNLPEVAGLGISLPEEGVTTASILR